MTNRELIEILKKFPLDMPITINECMDFTEMDNDTIKVSKRAYIDFPFTETDTFNYINLEIRDKAYWG